MVVADGVPEMTDAVPSIRLLEPRLSKPLVRLRFPFIVTDFPKLTPAVLLISNVELVAVEITPAPEISCAAVPLRLIVPADAGAKLRIPPVPTVILPLIEWPGIPVMLKLNVPLVIVRLSIATAVPPVVVTVKVGASISKLA